jgi:hypothetical protein
LQYVNVYCASAVFITALEYSLYAASPSSSDAFLEKTLDFVVKAQPSEMLLLELKAGFMEPWSEIDDDACLKVFHALKAYSLGTSF